MYHKVLHYIKENKMLDVRDKVVVGVSGGADSVCLLFVLLEVREIYGLELFVVHVNHGLRGEEAKQDACYVEKLCRVHGISYTLAEEDVQKVSKETGVSEEEAGRNIRYRVFYDVLKKFKANKIAVAHNLNDQAETVLFQLFRGSGMKGLSGISPVRDSVIRPLLCISRTEIESYLLEHKISYQTDKTNLMTDYSRNKIRIEVLPYVEKHINRRAAAHIAESAVILKEIEAYVKKNAKDCFERIVMFQNGQYSFLVEKFQKEDIVIQKAIIQIIFEQLAGKLKDITKEHRNMALSLAFKEVGKRMDFPYSIVGIREYTRIRFYRKTGEHTVSDSRQNENVTEIKIPGTYYLEQLNQTITFELLESLEDISFEIDELSESNYKKNMIIPQNGYTKWFDYDKIKNAVFLRTRREGDFIQIDQKGGRKKIKAFFIDKKIQKEERDKIPLLADGSHIIWVIGDRISEGYKIDENTKKILCVKLYGGKKDES